MYIFTSRVKLM